MNWLPSLLNWPTAAVAAAIAVPALLVLYFLKLRRRELAISSTLLWKKSIQDLQVNSPFQKLRKNLLLLLQLLLLLLLLLALARPVVNYAPGAGKLTVLLIDHSASMSAKDADGMTRLDQAKQRAKALVDTMQRGALAMVVAFDDSAQTLQSFSSDAVGLKNAIDSIAPTDRPTRFELAYQLAAAQMNINPEQLRANAKDIPEVRLYSDGRAQDIADASISAPVTLERIGSDNAGNIAIVSLSAKRNYERPTQVQVFARLANFGPAPADASVRLKVDGQEVETGGVSGRVFLLPDRWSEKERQDYERDSNNRPANDGVQFELELTRGAVIGVEQTRTDGDALRADDTAQVIVPPPRNLTVMIVSDGNYFLEKAIRAQTQIKEPKFVTPQQYAQGVQGNFDVIIFDRYKPLALPEAGNFIYFGALPDGLTLKVEKDPASGVERTIEDVGVLDWKREHPVLRGINLGRLYVATALKLDVPLDSEVLLDGLKGPLIVRHQEGKHTHLAVGFDVLQSNWPLRQSFPYFLYNALQYLAVGAELDLRQSVAPGSAPNIPRTNLLKGSSPIKSVVLIDPAGQRQTLSVPDSGDFTLPPLNRVGIYKTEPPIPGWEQIAVNLLDANESNLLPVSQVPSAQAVVDATRAGTSRRELWWLLACVALGMLFVEWWVYTRRVHL